MADVRCPMCGKTNPPDTVICKFCQARLEPLVAPPSFENDDLNPGPPDQDSPAENGALPDWLDGLRGEDESSQEETNEDRAGEISGDWSFEDEDRLSSAFSAPLNEEEGQDQDWLSRLVGEEHNQAEQDTDDEVEDGPRSASAAFLSMDELLGEEGSSDWLAEFQTSSLGLEEPSESPQEAEQAFETLEEAERPHWLDSIRSQQQNESDQEELPASSEDTGQESDEPEKAEHAASTHESDWLLDIGIDEGGDDFVIDSKDLPNWMTTSDTLQQQESPEPTGTIPGWMAESELSQEGPTSPGEGSLPNWLTAGDEPEEGAAKTPRPDFPDWLSETSNQELDHSGLPEPVESEEEQALVNSEESGLPDWLTRLDATSGPSHSPDSGSNALILGEEEQAEITEQAASGESPAEGDYSAVPDWLTQISSQEEQAELAAPHEEEIEPDLAEAQLPSWLQAMRPVESAAPSAPAAEDQAHTVEKVGPLAGLAGVLAAEPEFVHMRKPQSSLVKLQVSDSQQSHITLLENLLAEEGQAKPVIARSAITSQYFLRLLIGLVVLVSVILPLWLNRQMLPLPAPNGVPSEVYEFGRTIGELPTGVPVLVAFDYEPGFSGELDATAGAVLAEMATRGINLAMISTNPTGPLLAERFATARQLDSGEGYVNLGYVPGGAAGLLAFAQAPREVVPFDLDGARVWETTPLSAVNALSDFGAVMVLTENPDTARSWIEQAQPFLGIAGKPLLMVLSAQAEPLVRPYYETSPRQVSGMISGLAGGAAYESISGNSGLSRLYWDAFGIGLVSAVALILVGGLVSLVLALLSQPKKNEVEVTL